MKKLLILSPILFISFFALGQVEKKSSIEMAMESASGLPELNDLLRFERIDYVAVNFLGKDLIGKDYMIIVKEIWNGEIKTADTVINTATSKWMSSITSDSLSFKVIAKKHKEDQIKIFFRFPSFGIEKKFDATVSDDYNLRSLGDKIDIRENENFYALAYIMPYEENGAQMYCEVDSSGKDVELWGREFDIEHYIVFEMKFESSQ